MPDASLSELVLRLFGACLLGGAVGYQREITGHPAGMRTHILVCVGAALFTITSIAFGGTSDPSRIAASIVTGIGFLGAGAIIRQGSSVKGLTTAASLWSTAAIGMALGAGGKLYVLAIVGTLIVFGVLSWVEAFERRMCAAEVCRQLYITLRSREGDTAPIFNTLAMLKAEVLGVSSGATEDGRRTLTIRAKLPPQVGVERVNAALVGVPVVESIDWE